MKIQQIRIEFNVTPQIRRYVFVYLIKTDTGCYLIDSGVAGSEKIIEKTIDHFRKKLDRVFSAYLRTL